MIKRLIRITAILAVAAMTAAGGVAFAKGGVHHHKAAHHAAVHHAAVVDNDTVQSGDQTTPDPVGASAAAETGSEETPSDGPGGHEDPPGEVDNQEEGTL